VHWVSLGLLAAAAVLLSIFWGHVPDSWITHWGPHGPDGWATKTVGNAALPLVLGLVIWLLFEVLARFVGRRAASSGAPRELRAVYATVLRAVGLATSLLFAAIAVALPLLQPRSSAPIAVGFPLVIGVVVGAAMIWAARETRRLRAAGMPVPEGYHGVFYSNPRDTRLWVPRISGLGWTLNFAHRLAWPVMIALLGVPLAIVLLISLAGR
jgi:uncharacterized membrane protein